MDSAFLLEKLLESQALQAIFATNIFQLPY